MVLVGLCLLVDCRAGVAGRNEGSDKAPKETLSKNDRMIEEHAQQMIQEGRRIFCFETFGSEAFWGETLQLHRAIAGEENGGVGGAA